LASLKNGPEGASLGCLDLKKALNISGCEDYEKRRESEMEEAHWKKKGIDSLF